MVILFKVIVFNFALCNIQKVLFINQAPLKYHFKKKFVSLLILRLFFDDLNSKAIITYQMTLSVKPDRILTRFAIDENQSLLIELCLPQSNEYQLSPS